MARRVRVAAVTNNPVAFRVPVFDRVANDPDLDFKVYYCARREPGRKSDVPPLEHPHHFLKESYRLRGDGYSVHNNPDVYDALRDFDPDVVLNSGFQPTNLYAFSYTASRFKAHVPAIDGTLDSERGMSAVHRGVRRTVFSCSTAFVGASEGSWRLYAQYGVPRNRFFQSHLCVDNTRYVLDAPEKTYDFLFCGRMVPEKRPDFALDVARETARLLGREVSLLFVGGGPWEEEARSRIGQVPGVRIVVHGFAVQDELPALYGSARLFLFPTAMDTWGVVANEACAAGLPVLVTPYAGVVGELVVDGENGCVADFDAPRWAQAATRLLSDSALWQRYSDESRRRVAAYTYDAAAQGFIAASRYAHEEGSAAPAALAKAGAVASVPAVWLGLELLELI